MSTGDPATIEGILWVFDRGARHGPSGPGGISPFCLGSVPEADPSGRDIGKPGEHGGAVKVLQGVLPGPLDPAGIGLHRTSTAAVRLDATGETTQIRLLGRDPLEPLLCIRPEHHLP